MCVFYILSLSTAAGTRCAGGRKMYGRLAICYRVTCSVLFVGGDRQLS
jgi:hypothetical protein